MENNENLQEINLPLEKLSKGNTTKECLQCQQKFKTWTSLVRRGAGKFCSHKCSLSYWQTGEKNNNWKGGRKIDFQGYILIKNKTHPFRVKGDYIREHRLAMEDWLKANDPASQYLIEINGERYLKRDLVVHHIDHDKQNNNVQNLMIMSNHDHGVLENTGERNPMFGKTPWNKK